MALVRSRSTEIFPHHGGDMTSSMSATTRKLQEALYTHLDDAEKSEFIEALSLYGTQRDIFELVNELRKILNTPVKRRLFPLVRQVIRPGDVEAFDLLTRGDKHHSSTLPRPYLYRPHIADLNVLKKHRASSLGGGRSRARHRNGGWSSSTVRSSGDAIFNSSRNDLDPQRGASSGRDDKHKTLSRRSNKSEDRGEVIEMDIGAPDEDSVGFGFTIRGGHEHKVGVYVSDVDKGTSAHRCGLSAGDLILEANNINFRNITHEEATLLIKSATYLVLTVSRVGRIPDSHTVLETFKWTDPKGRPVSPPGGWEDDVAHGGEDEEGGGKGGGGGAEIGRGARGVTDAGAYMNDEGRMRSGSLMLKGRDERKVNVVVEKGHGLGLMVRGGREYKLGIFISAIDHFSVAANAGLKVGDQILDVNGRSFLDVTHSEAVRHLKSGRHLMMTVKDVGKIPFAKTTIDETGWVQSSKFNTYVNSVSSRRSVPDSLSDADFHERGFSKGAGSQLMRSSTVPSVRQQRELIHDQARLLLNDREQMTLNYYIGEYEKKTINLNGFSHALFEILNTPAKMTLLSELRTAIQPKDLNEFDQIVMEHELQSSLTEARGMLAPDVLSMGSFDSHDASTRRKAKRTMFSQQIKPPEPIKRMDRLDFGEERENSPINYKLLATSQRLSRSTPSLASPSPLTRREFHQRRDRDRSGSSSRPNSPPSSAYQLMTQRNSWGQQESHHQRVHEGTKGQGNQNARGEDPSDDSGVEINQAGHNSDTNNNTTNQHHSHHHHQQQRHNATSPVNASGPRTTFTPVRPKIYQGSYAKNLSSPQKKILHHLQRRDGGMGASNTVGYEGEGDGRRGHREGGGGGVGGGGGNNKWYISSPSSTSSRQADKQMKHVVAEIHRRPEESSRDEYDYGDDDDDDVGRFHNKPDGSKEGKHYKHPRTDFNSSRRSRSLQRHHQRLEDAERARSKSRSRAKSTDPNVARRDHSRGRSRSKENHRSGEAKGGLKNMLKTSNSERNLFSSRRHNSDKYDVQNYHNIDQNTDRERSYPLHSRETSRLPQQYDVETSSNSTIVNSIRSHSTLTINGQPMSPTSSTTNRSNHSHSHNKPPKTSNRIMDLFSRKGADNQKRNNNNKNNNDISENDKPISRTNYAITVNSNKKVTLLSPPVSFSPTTSKRLQSLNSSQQSRSNSKSLNKSPKITRSPNLQRRRPRAEEVFSSREDLTGEQNDMSSYLDSSLESSPRGDYNQRDISRYTSDSSIKSLGHSNTINITARQSDRTRASKSQHKLIGGPNQNWHDARPANPNDQSQKSSSVPLIRINSKSLPKVEAATLRSSIKIQNPNSPEQTNNDVYAVPYKSIEDRVTISDIPVEINADSENDASTSSVYSTSFLVNSNNNISNNINNKHHSHNANNAFRKPAAKSRIEAIKEKAIEKYGELPVEVVYIYRSKPTLGVAIEGGANTRQPLPRVINVQPGGSAFESGGLKVGHVVLEVNSTPAVGLSHMDAARLIAEAFKNKESNRMELLVTQWSDELLDVIKVDAELLKVESG